jgi:hypothetical protein
MSESWWFAPAAARRLATLRILIGGYAFVYLLSRLHALVAVAGYPARQFRPVGPVHLLDQPLPEWVVVALVASCIALGVAFLLGWRLRWVGPAFAALLVWVVSYRNSWGMVFHTENLLVLHVWVLGCCRSADALSLDARGTGDLQAPPDSGRYGWPIRLLCAITVATYLIAGVAKLRVAGLGWVFDDTLRGLVAYDNVRKIELGAGHSALGGFLVGYDWLFPPLAAVSLLIEVGAPVALVGRRVGMAWAALAWSFHLGVLAMMFILFHYQLFAVAYAPFFPVERISDRLEPRLRRLARVPFLSRWIAASR